MRNKDVSKRTSTDRNAARRIRCLLAALSLTAAMIVTVGLGPAHSTVGPYVSYINAADSDHAVFTALPDGSSATRVTPKGFSVWGYEVSRDGSTLLTYGSSDIGAIVMTRGNVSRVIATLWDMAPTLSADGNLAFIVSYADLYEYNWATNHTTRITRNQVLWHGPMPDGELYPQAISVNPTPGTSQLAIFWGDFGGAGHVVQSAIEVVDFSKGGWRSLWQTPTYGSWGPAVVAHDAPLWVDATHVLYWLCDTSRCSTWKVMEVSLTEPISETLMPALTNVYNIQPFGSNWLLTKTSGTGSATVTSHGITSDLNTPPATWTQRPDGPTTSQYIATLAQPPAQRATVASRFAIRPIFTMSSTTARTGDRVVYESYGMYDPRIGDMTVPSEGGLGIESGILQASVDGGRTFRNVQTTKAGQYESHGFFGNGETPALVQNTYFRWYHPSGMFTKSVTSPARLVKAAPRFTLHVTSSGSKVVVAGHVARVGGRVSMYMGKRLIGTAGVTRAGTFSFGARPLVYGTYTVRSTADTKWTTSTCTFTV